MMKKNHAARLGALALALTLVSTCLMGGTLAKYTTTVTGTATATVAKWSFKANGETATIADIDLGNTLKYNANNIISKVIAPGTEGSFDIIVDATGSEVGIDYTIRFSDVKNKPTNLLFYKDSEHKDPINDLFIPGNTGFDGIIDANATDKTVTKTVYWAWSYNSTDNDVADTAYGKDDSVDKRKMTFRITVTGTQVDPKSTSSGS